MTFMPRSVLNASAADEIPALRVSTKYMQTFQMVKPALGGTDLKTHLNSRGDLDIYSVGTGDQVYLLRRGEKSDAPYSERSLGFAARQLFVYEEGGVNPDTPTIMGINTSGQLTLASYKADIDTYIQTVCQPPSATQKLHRFLGVRGATGGIYANVILDSGVLANNFMKPGTTTWAGAEWVPILGPDGKEVKPKTITMCENDPVQSALFAIGEQGEVLFSEESFRGTKMRALSTPSTLNAATHLSVVADANGKLNIFAVQTTSGALWWKKERKYSTGGEIQFDDWVKISSNTDTPLTRIYAGQRFDGLLQVFGIGTNGRLYRATQADVGAGKISWRALFPLGNSIDNAIFSVGRTAQGYAEAYTVTPNGEIKRLWQSPTTEQWLEETVQLPKHEQEMAEIQTHATEVTVLDEAGMPKPFADLSISASNLVTLFVDGKSYRCSQVDRVAIKSDACGKAVIHQQANALAATTLYVEMPGTLVGAPVQVQPNMQLQGLLSSRTANDILNAKDASGKFLLPEKYRTPEYAESLKKITAASMNIAAQQESGNKVSYKFISRRAAVLGFNPRTDFSALNDSAWEIDFSSGFPIYKDLSIQDVDAWKKGKLATLSSESELGGFLGIDWGNVWNGIKSGVEWILGGLKKIVVSFINGVGKVLFEIGEAVFEAVIMFAQQAFDFVEGVWNWLEVKLKQLYEWLAFFFDFGDIARTAEVVRHCIGTVLDFSAAGVDHIKDVIVKGIDTLKDDIKEAVDRFVADLNKQNNPTMQAFSSKNNPSDDQMYQTEHNLFLNAYKQNYENATPELEMSFIKKPELASALDSVIEMLTELSNNFQFEDGKEAFNEAVGYFTSIGSNPDRALELLMSGVVKTLEATALFAVDFARGVIITLMDAISTLIGTFRDVIFSEWKIPVVSDLYKLFTGKALTISVVDILSYLVAIPGTLIFKLITNRAPFPDQASVEAFKSFFTVAWLKSKMGMSLSDYDRQVLSQQAAGNKDVKIIFLSFYSAAMACRLFTDAVTAFNSAKAGAAPEPTAALPKPPVMAGISIGLRYVTTLSTCPWLLNTSLGAPQCGAGNAGFAGVIWICQIVFGPTRGAVIAALMPNGKAKAYTGEITLSIWGATQIIMVVWHYCWTPSNEQDPLSLSRTLTNVVPGQFLRFLATPDMNQKGEFIPFAIFAVVQTLSFIGSIGCAITEAVNAAEAAALIDQRRREEREAMPA